MNAMVEVKQNDLLTIISNATVDPNVSVEKLERLYALYEKDTAHLAKMAYSQAMTAAQQEMPKVIKTKKNEQTNSNYPDLSEVNEKITPIYTKWGFSASFGTSKADQENWIRITCTISHDKGHSEPFYIDLPPDQTGIKGTVNKTLIHAIGSTYSYGQRYLITKIFNVTIAGEDDDGQKAGQQEHDKEIFKKGFNKGLEYGMNCYKLKERIEAIKDYIADGDIYAAAYEYYKMSNIESMSIRLAPTKGGIFTIDEKKVIDGGSDDWCAGRTQSIKDHPDVDRSF